MVEERAAAEAIWQQTQPTSLLEKLVDYLQNKTLDHHITTRILKGVMFGIKYADKQYPMTKEQKYDDIKNSIRLCQLFEMVREREEFRYIAIGTGLIHDNPDTHDDEFVICDLTTTQPRNSKKMSSVTKAFREIRQQFQTTMENFTEVTVGNAMRSESERTKARREDLQRRKRGNKGGNYSP